MERRQKLPVSCHSNAHLFEEGEEVGAGHPIRAGGSDEWCYTRKRAQDDVAL